MKNKELQFFLTGITRSKLSFDGGDISSDGGLLLLNEFMHKIGLPDIIWRNFKTKDSAFVRFHTDTDNLFQLILQVLAGYFTDDSSDDLRKDPVFTSVLCKDALASQPTLSRFMNRMDSDTLDQFNKILRELRKIAYSIEKPNGIVLDLDSTLLDTYGNQEEAGFNFHYQAEGYHPLVLYDCVTGYLLKAELRNGTQYCSKDAAEFMRSILAELKEDFPDVPLIFRADSGFASPDLYEVLEEFDCYYVIRLKENPVLKKRVGDTAEKLHRATKYNMIDQAVEYDDFTYAAGSWSKERRVVCEVCKPENSFIMNYMFVVTNFQELAHYQVLDLYRGRGQMENLIKESKNGFDFAAVSSHKMITNANRLWLRALAYNIFNMFKRLVLPENLCAAQADTIRVRLIKVAVRITHSGRYTNFKLCSSYVYKKEFVNILSNIEGLFSPESTAKHQAA